MRGSLQPVDLLRTSRRHIVLPRRVGPPRGPTENQARGPRWRRVAPDLYVPAATDPMALYQRIAEAACGLPDANHCGVTGWAALAWAGGRWFTGRHVNGGPRPVPLAVGGEMIRRRAGRLVSEERLDPRDLTVLDGLPATTLVRAACFEMRYGHTVDAAVTVLAMAAYDDLVSVAELAAYVDRHQGWTGIQLCRDALPLVPENAWSPTEVEMLLEWGRHRPGARLLCNAPVFDERGRHVATPDLIDAETGVVGEYDGDAHLDRARRAADVGRDADMRRVGLEPVVMTAADRSRTWAFLARVDQAYARAGRVPRRWTLQQPSWWVDTSTVAARRALSTDQRARLLRYRTNRGEAG